MGLKWGAVDFDNGTISIEHTAVQVDKTIHKKGSTKNDSSYATIPMSNMIETWLKKWRAQQAECKLLQPSDYVDEGYVCTQFDGNLFRSGYLTQHFLVLLRQNSMPRIRFHDLRHSSAGFLKYLGFDLKDIQVWLRHKDIQTTANLYLNLDMSAKTEIANTLGERLSKFAF